MMGPREMVSDATFSNKSLRFVMTLELASSDVVETVTFETETSSKNPRLRLET